MAPKAKKAWLVLLNVGAVISKQVLQHQMLSALPSTLPLPNMCPKRTEVNGKEDGCVVPLEPHPLPKGKLSIFNFVYITLPYTFYITPDSQKSDYICCSPGGFL